MSVETQEYITYEEAASFLSVSMTKLYNIVSIGYLHSIRPYQAGKRRSHKRYLMVKELEAYRRGEIATVENSQLPAQVNSFRGQDKVSPILPITNGNLVAHQAIPLDLHYQILDAIRHEQRMADTRVNTMNELAKSAVAKESLIRMFIGFNNDGTTYVKDNIPEEYRSELRPYVDGINKAISASASDRTRAMVAAQHGLDELSAKGNELLSRYIDEQAIEGVGSE